MTIRYLSEPLKKHLSANRQMAFIVGPRQVGKTTLAESFLKEVKPGWNYFNWDDPRQRKILLQDVFTGRFSFSAQAQPIVVFDEIHKYPRWKNSLKGLFDLHQPNTHWIITGSAALDVYRKGQDSLVGRHFTYHLCPYSVAELLGMAMSPSFVSEIKSSKLVLEKPSQKSQESLEKLFRLGGFPEPLFKEEESFLNQWRTTRIDRLINQDLAALEQLRHLPLVENLVLLLPERVGNPLSINSLREDLNLHFSTVKHWLELLSRVFYGFPIYPYTGKLTRMLKKEMKYYLWDWTEIKDPGYRFENMTAVHLQKWISYLNDTGCGLFSLHYLRDKEKREVDFLICEDRKPLLAVECKYADRKLSPSLCHYAEALKIPYSIQLCFEPAETWVKKNVLGTCHTSSAASFFEKLV